MQRSYIHCLIIDDDPFFQNLFRDKLSRHVPEVKLLAIAGSGKEGLQKIARHQPDLVFLDVEMSDMTGFEMLAQLDDIPFQTIFVTAYNHYAIKAIRFNALDYLVKPVDLGELKRAVQRYRKNLKKGNTDDRVRQALINLKTPNGSEQTLTLQTQGGEWRLPLKHIIRIEAERNYSSVYLINGKRKIAARTLGDMEELLNDKGFFRCHKSHLVNYSHIISRRIGISMILSNGQELPIARRKKEEFEVWYKISSRRP